MCLDCNCGVPTPTHSHSHSHSHSPSHNPEASPHHHLELGQNLLSRNDAQAAANRSRFRSAGLPVINLLSSPGSGKTSLLERMARDWGASHRMAAVVGDLATDNDARRLRNAGLQAIQITTGQACHLEAAMVQTALASLESDGIDLAALDLLVIENVGNLVCPTAYDLGESLRVVMLSVTEGEDKPLKYPATFHAADVVVISKIDLSAAVGFERSQAHRHIAQVAPRARVVEVSARSGAGMDELRAALGLAIPSPL